MKNGEKSWVNFTGKILGNIKKFIINTFYLLLEGDNYDIYFKRWKYRRTYSYRKI